MFLSVVFFFFGGVGFVVGAFFTAANINVSI